MKPKYVSPPIPGNSNANWANNGLQFARVIEEAQAAGAFTPEVIAAMSESMDLEPAQIHELLDRARVDWERATASL